MKVIVTGGLGFLGSHLVETLAAAYSDIDIIIIDNLSSNVIGPADTELTLHVSTVQSYFEKLREPFDAVFHLASVVGPTGVIPHRGTISKRVVDDAMAVAEAARYHSARMIDVSTSEVYGGGDKGFCSEAMAKIVPAKPSARLEYAVGKLAAEVSLQNQVNDGLDVVIVRPFNIAGPRQQPDGGFVLPRFVQAALKNSPLTVYGDGKQVRAFTHVRDTCRGLIAAMERGFSGEVYNIGNAGNMTTIRELATKVIATAKSQSSIQFVDPQTLWGPEFAEAADKWPDPRKAEEELGWEPMFSLDDIVTDTISEWQKT